MSLDESNIGRISDEEAERLPRLCEIRFDCLVTMYEMNTIKTVSGLLGKMEKPIKPQWFKSINKITLNSIKHSSEYQLGRMLKDMLQQLELHIQQYEK